MGIYLAAFYSFEYFNLFGYLFFIVLSICYLQVNKNHNAKTPLRYTARIKRLISLLVVIIVSINFCILFLVPFRWSYILFGLIQVATIPLSILAMLLIAPIEKAINNRYIKQAKNKLHKLTTKKEPLIVVGITGSFGKTTAKNILKALLSTKYKVCATQGNYNTPMGITLTINNDLKQDDQVLLLEMGARYRQDIKELTGIAPLDYCLLTSIGDCHIATFGSQQAIIETKCDIVDGLKDGGIAVVCADNDCVKERLKGKDNIIFITSNDKNKPQFAFVQNIKTTTRGTCWIQNINDISFEMSTVLLGEHIPHIVNLCIALAYKMGITDIVQIKQAISDLQAVPHRLQLIQNTSAEGTVVIDDSYNANIESIKTAINVLSKFDNYKKIIITPGIVEQGQNEVATNTQIGTIIAKVCDYAFLIGSRNNYIANGIDEYKDSDTNKNLCQIHKFDNRDQSVTFLQTLSGKKVVLFCNDLPDNFV